MTNVNIDWQIQGGGAFRTAAPPKTQSGLLALSPPPPKKNSLSVCFFLELRIIFFTDMSVAMSHASDSKAHSL